MAQRIRWIAWAFAATTVFFMLPREIRHPDFGTRDASTYWLAVTRIHQNISLYEPMPDGPIRPERQYYLYPPALAPALSLLPDVSWPKFSALWTTVLFLSMWGFAAALAFLAGGLTPSRWAIAVLAVGLTPGGVLALGMANVDPLLWALSGLALATVGNWRGFAFAAVAVVKPYAVFPLLFASARNARRVVTGASIALALVMAAGTTTMSVSGFYAACQYWVRNVLPRIGQGSEGITNLSLTFALSRLVGATRWLPTVMAIAVPLAVGWRLRTSSARLQLSCVLASPYLLPTYLPLLLLPVAVLVGERRCSPFGGALAARSTPVDS